MYFFLLWSGLLQVSTVAVIAMVMLYLAATFHEALPHIPALPFFLSPHLNVPWVLG